MHRLRNLLTTLVLGGLFFAAIPTSFAGSLMGVESLATVEGTDEVEVTEEDLTSCYDCYYNPYIYLNVSVTTQWEPDRLTYYANYSTSGETRGAVARELNLLFEKTYDELSPYGTVRRTGLYVYNSWDGSGDYIGDLSVEIQVTDLNNSTRVDEGLFDLGFSTWVDAVIENTVAVESSVADELKNRIEQKEEVYETILGYSLGNITGLSIWTWANGYSYNSVTDMVDVTVSADVSYTPSTE